MDADRPTPASTGPDGAGAAAVEPASDPATTSEVVTVVADGSTSLVRVRGDIDASTAPVLRAVLLEILEQRPDRIRVDMAQVEFLDSAGISVLVSTYNRAEGAGIGFELAAVPPSSRRVLEITRLTEVFTIVD